MLKRYSLLAGLAVALFALSGCYVGAYSGSAHVRTTASVARVAYYGPHPVYDIYDDDDWCGISGIHYHDYAPDSDDFYVRDNGRYVFVGDPTYYVSNVNFNTYYYMGPHPLPVGNNWCYINGPHRHHWAASGYYNYTRVGSYNYYTYTGERNSYYNPNHVHYDLHTYYSSYQPVRYSNTGRVSVGMSQPRPNVPNSNSVYVAPSMSNSRPTARPSYNTSTNNYTYTSRPTTTTTARPGVTTTTTTTRPTGTVANRPTPTTNYPSTTTTTTSRPNTTTNRPTTTTSNRPTQTTNNYPSTTTTTTTTTSRPTQTTSRPTGTVTNRPTNTTSNNYPSTTTTTTTTTTSRPTQTTSRPTGTATNRPTNTTSNNYPNTTTTTTSRPTQTTSRPTGTATNRPSGSTNRPTSTSSGRTGSGGRVDAPTGKSQYMDSEEEENSRGNGSSNRRGRAVSTARRR